MESSRKIKPYYTHRTSNALQVEHIKWKARTLQGLQKNVKSCEVTFRTKASVYYLELGKVVVWKILVPRKIARQIDLKRGMEIEVTLKPYKSRTHTICRDRGEMKQPRTGRKARG